MWIYIDKDQTLLTIYEENSSQAKNAHDANEEIKSAKHFYIKLQVQLAKKNKIIDMLVWRGIHDKILHQHQNIYVNKLYVYIDL